MHFVLNARVRFNVVRSNTAKKSVTVFYGEAYLEKYSLRTYVV